MHLQIAFLLVSALTLIILS